jgi:hypothetical protein
MKTKQRNSKNIKQILLALLFLFAIAAAGSCGGGGGGDGGGGGTSGGGGTPNISVSPASLNSGTVSVGFSSNPQTATINNTGAADLGITSIGISGADANQFSQTNNCPASLTAGSSCNVQVTFTPTSAGAKNANLTIVSNDADTPTTNVGLSGTGITGDISVSPTSLDFGSVSVGASSPPQTATISNIGTGNLFINFVMSGTYGSQFSYTTTCAATLSSGASCNVEVTFSPTLAGGPMGASLGVNSTDPDTPLIYINLSGTGSSNPVPNISVSTTFIGFGNYYEGTSSLPQTATILNTGTASLVIGTITLTGTDVSQFSKQNDVCSAQTLAPSASCTLQVVFSPTSAGAKSASLAIPSNDLDTPTVNVGLAGTGVAAPNISATCYQDDGTGNLVQVSCNPVPMTTCLPFDGATVTITNAGTADLNITSLTITGTGASYFSIVSDACTGAPVTANSSCDVTVSFFAATAGTRVASFAIVSNDPDTPTLNVGLRGVYVNPNLCP